MINFALTIPSRLSEKKQPAGHATFANTARQREKYMIRNET